MALRKAGASFDVTQYPQTKKIIGEIRKKCDAHNIRVNISPLVKEFMAVSDGSVIGDVKENWRACELKTLPFSV